MRIEENICNSFSDIFNINHSQIILTHIESNHLLSTKLLRTLAEKDEVLIIKTSMKKSIRNIEINKIIIAISLSIKMRDSV